MSGRAKHIFIAFVLYIHDERKLIILFVELISSYRMLRDSLASFEYIVSNGASEFCYTTLSFVSMFLTIHPQLSEQLSMF